MRVDKLPEIFPVRTDATSSKGGRHLPARIRWRWTYAGLACAGLAYAAACSAQEGHPVVAQTALASAGSQAPVNAATETKPLPETAAKPAQVQKSDTSDSERKKHISDEGSQLLAMALSLKAEVDKTNKDTLSLNVIRKADAIERLAKTVKEKTRQGAGPG